MITFARLGQHLDHAALRRAAAVTARKLRTGESPAGYRCAGRVLALAAAQRGDSPHAAALLRDDPLIPAAPPLPTDFAFLAMAARVALAAADQQLRKRLLETTATLESGAADAPAFTAVAAHVHGVLTRDVKELLTAAKLQTAAGRPLLAASALEDAAVAVAPEDRDTDAVQWLDQALASYSEAGAVADTQRVRRSLSERGAAQPVGAARPDSWESLTDAELKVVHLIAAGATNRNAAQQLYLSPHTASTHVRNVFTKLGINSRVHLAHVLRDHS